MQSSVWVRLYVDDFRTGYLILYNEHLNARYPLLGAFVKDIRHIKDPAEIMKQTRKFGDGKFWHFATRAMERMDQLYYESGNGDEVICRSIREWVDMIGDDEIDEIVDILPYLKAFGVDEEHLQHFKSLLIRCIDD